MSLFVQESLHFQEMGKSDKYVSKETMVPVLVSSNVLVLREEEAFSFGSFVADCGGVLGLFVGFNFLMVWGWMWKFLLFVVNRVNKKKIIDMNVGTK